MSRTGRRRCCCRSPSLLDALPRSSGMMADALRRGPLPATTPFPPPQAPQRRILALHLPWLATERFRVGPLHPAVACWATEGHRRVLTAVGPTAATAGLRPRQTVADAQAILPGVALIPADPAADRAWLERLALWALSITPLPAVNPPDGLLLDVTGVAHLHGGEAALLRDAATRFARAGVTAHGAIADGPVAAAALARSVGEKGAIIPPGGEAGTIAPLPLSALRLPPEAVKALHRMGVRCVRDALRLPRGPLARRFGATLVDVLDAAVGRRSLPIIPVRPPPKFAAALGFPEPITTREAIDATLDRLLALLCRRLAAASCGARRLVLSAFRVDGVVQEVTVSTGLAQRDATHFARLFREGLVTLDPGFGLERLSLEAPATEPLGVAQGALPGRDGTISREMRSRALAQLLDRLSQRLPVWRLAPRLSHWPERTVARVGAFEAAASPSGWPGLAPRPPCLLRRPVPLRVVAMLPDAPPSLLRKDEEVWRVLRAEGPERLVPEWWLEGEERRPIRDYYRVELASGARLWVCRARAAATPDGAAARWWLHGRFA